MSNDIHFQCDILFDQNSYVKIKMTFILLSCFQRASQCHTFSICHTFWPESLCKFKMSYVFFILLSERGALFQRIQAKAWIQHWVKNNDLGKFENGHNWLLSILFGPKKTYVSRMRSASGALASPVSFALRSKADWAPSLTRMTQWEKRIERSSGSIYA